MQLRETIPFQYAFTEATQDQKRTGILGTIKGTFQRADSLNCNKRVYPRGLWERVLGSADVQDRLSNRAMVGELDHPQSGGSISRVSHVITKNELRPDGVVYGEAEVLDTPSGRIAETLFRAGVRLGISSRGDGTVKEEGGKSVVKPDDYKLETYDLVLKPSTPGAYPTLSEEEQTQEDKAILEAVEGLVKQSEDPKVLLESVKLLNCVRGETSEAREAIARDAQAKLVALYERAQSSPPTPSPQGLQEVREMSDENKQNLNEGLVRDLAAKKIAEAESQFAARLSAKDTQIADLAEKLATSQKEYKAAEDLVEELLRKVEDAKGQGLREGEATYRAKYNAACQLVEEALRRIRPLNEAAKRYVAARDLLTEAHAVMGENRVLNAIDTVLSEVPAAKKQQVFDILRECHSVKAVYKTWESLKNLGGTKLYEDQRAPLPHQRQAVAPGRPAPSPIDEKVTPAAKSFMRLDETAARMRGEKRAAG